MPGLSISRSIPTQLAFWHHYPSTPAACQNQLKVPELTYSILKPTPATTAGNHRAICSEIVAPSNLFVVLNTLEKGKARYFIIPDEQQFLAYVRIWTTASKEDLLYFDPKGFMPILKNHNKRPDQVNKFITANQWFEPKRWSESYWIKAISEEWGFQKQVKPQIHVKPPDIFKPHFYPILAIGWLSTRS